MPVKSNGMTAVPFETSDGADQFYPVLAVNDVELAASAFVDDDVSE